MMLEINPRGLEYIVKQAANGAFAEYSADFKKLARLTKYNGFEDCYEMKSTDWETSLPGYLWCRLLLMALL